MKNKQLLIAFSLLISILSFGQNNISLQQVDSLVQIRQPNAAQELLWKIIDKAKDENDSPTLIEAYPYFRKLLNPLEKEERAALYIRLINRSKELPEPAKSITSLQLTNEIAFSYYSWFNYNYNNTEDSMDLGNEEMRHHFILKNIRELEGSLAELQKFDFQPFKNSLANENDSLFLYRKLSDYVAYQLINLYKSSIVKNGGTIKSSLKDQKTWYETTDRFSELRFQDSSLTVSILKLFQNIEKNNFDYPPFSSTAIYQRLHFLKDEFSNEEEIANAWENEYNYFKNFSSRSKFLFEIAKIKYLKGARYHYKNNPEVEGLIKTAHNELTSELKKFPKSDFSSDLKDLIKVIEYKEVQFSFPQITPPKQQIPLLISHRNYSHRTFRIYKVDDNNPLESKSLRNYVKNNQLSLVRTLDLDLKNKELFQKRSVEMLIDGIEHPGQYILVSSKNDDDLSKYADIDSLWYSLKLVSNQITVSEISATTNNNNTVLVVDQVTGKPIKGAQIELYVNNYRTNNKWKKIEEGTTNKEGLFLFKNRETRRVNYVIKYKGSVLTGNDYLINVGENTKSNRVGLFTDRSIYRPGQTVHFKGVAFEGKENDLMVIPNKNVTITLRDASYQEVFKESFKTNSFGSIDGEIVLPQHSSLGSFTLIGEVEGASSYNIVSRIQISVEEYKRPTFEVELNQPKEEAKLNDSVAITGNAKAFAGYPISNAKVTYSVYRKWNRYWRFYNSSSSGDLLTQDTIMTDGKGDFNIDFFAATDPNAVKNAYYYYEVKVKVTDLSGETHEKSLSLNLSETGLSIQFSAPDKIRSHEAEFAKINIVNMAGEPQDGFTGKLEIYKKTSPQKFISRIWERAETSEFDEAEFSRLFPYMEENSSTNKDEERLLKTIDFKSGDSLNLNKILEGRQGEFIFKLKTTTTKGATLKAEKTVEVVDVQSKGLPVNQALWTFVSSHDVEVGNDIDFQVGSSFKNASALLSVYRGKELISREWVSLKDRYSKCYTVKEEDRGFLTFDVIIYHNGKFYTDEVNVFVPFSNKKLDIKVGTFRDLLEPGQKESWSFQVKDNTNEFVDAELAATMYDASLDQIRSNSWNFNPYNASGHYNNWRMSWSRSLRSMGSPNMGWKFNRLVNQHQYKYTELISRGFRGNDLRFMKSSNAMPSVAEEEEVLRLSDNMDPSLDEVQIEQKKEAESTPTGNFNGKEPEETVQPRTNFNETAFFYPIIYSNDSNEYVLNFTLPESLTKWKLLLLAHTKDVKTGTLQKKIEVRKELMVTGNIPRFVRQGDEIDFSTKVVNLTDEEQTVSVSLKLENPINDKVLSWTEDQLTKSVTIPASSSEEVSWRLNIGEEELMQYTVTASNASFSDGERNIIPVLSNRIAVVETDHLLIKTSGTVSHTFDAFKNQNSSTLENKSYTVEYIDNLAWQAVMALPYLSKVNDQSITSLANSYYANAISEHVVNSNPKIKTIFNQWKSKTPDALWSELEKNEELKTILLNETPWVMDAKNEAEQRRRIAQLFELNQLQDNQQGILNELKKRQNSDGGFSWFSGGKSNIYMTNAVLNRFGQLEHLGIKAATTASIIRSAERFLAQKQVEKYNNYIKRNKKQSQSELVKKYPMNDMDVYWLYSRTFFHHENSESINKIVALYKEKMKKAWTDFTPYGQALAGIYFKYQKMEKETQLIYASFLDRAKKSNDLGMYWVENSGYFWNEDKIGTQAMIVSFFQGMNAPKETMDNVRLWLILNKETHSWETGVNAADAIYAILMSGRDYLNSSSNPTIKVGNQEWVEHAPANENEIEVDWTPGLGQAKQQWTGSAVNPNMGTVTIDRTSESPAVLNLYWQYTEVLSKIKRSSNKSMQIRKTYRRIVPGVKDEKGILDSVFSRGDKIEVELIVTVDRDLEYVHIKDLRPAGFEPIMNLSGYHWENGLVYYQSPKDVSMDYFVEHIEKGTYKLTYTVYATHSGKFNSGMASVQCYYAPKFSGNSGTERVEIKR